MLTQTWTIPERKYRVREERDFSSPTSDDTKLNSYLYRPDADGKFPVILGVCAYSLDDQVAGDAGRRRRRPRSYGSGRS